MNLAVDPTTWTPPFDWNVLFGNDGPVEVELGCGKGMFLKEAARLRPAVNFLGVERAGKYYRTALARLERAGRDRVRLLRADGLDVLDRWVPPVSIRALHIYFPDPWPKKRHQKRRIFRPALFRLAAEAVAPGGELRMATDNQPYREAIEALCAAHREWWAPRPWPAEDPEQLPTNYALKWTRLGRPLWWARFERTATGVK